MSKNAILLMGGVGAVIVVLLTLWLDRERKKNNAQQEVIDAQQEAINAQQRTIEAQRNKNKTLLAQLQQTVEKLNIPAETRKELNTLIAQFQHTNEDIASELIGALAVIDTGQYSNATEKFAKILENILKKQFENDANFDAFVQRTSKQKNFATHIQYAKDQNLLDAAELAFIEGLRHTRNQEAHEINNEKRQGKTLLLGSLHIGISMICRLSAKLQLI